MKSGFFERLIVPGLIFQSTMIGGGYATGRELIEFFLSLGPVAGLMSMLVTTLVISVVCATAFELARIYRLYDYRLFFKKLLGPAWFLFEAAYLALILLVLSVLGAASGELLSASLGLQPIFGSLLLMLLIGGLVFWGSKAIERFLSTWSIILYIAYIILIVWSFTVFGDAISANLRPPNQGQLTASVVTQGVSYAGYNVVVFTAVLFVVRHFRKRSDAIWAGVLCGPLGMIPGFLLVIAMMAHYPAVIDEPLPINYLLDQLNTPTFIAVFQVVIFGTFIETGTGLLHSVNERVAEVFHEKQRDMPRYTRPVIAFCALFFAFVLADRVGIISLIGQGYVYSTYVFILIVILPLLSRGLYLIVKNPGENSPRPS